MSCSPESPTVSSSAESSCRCAVSGAKRSTRLLTFKLETETSSSPSTTKPSPSLTSVKLSDGFSIDRVLIASAATCISTVSSCEKPTVCSSCSSPL